MCVDTALMTCVLVARSTRASVPLDTRKAKSRTTLRYEVARANVDRHAAHAVAADVTGMGTG